MNNLDVALTDTVSMSELESSILENEIFKFLILNRESSMGALLRHFNHTRKNFSWGLVMGKTNEMIKSGALIVTDKRLLLLA